MRRPQGNTNHQREPKEFEEKVVQVNRVSKKTKGGNKIGFSVLVVVGDKKGKVGVGLGKGPDVLSSIKKAVKRAKKHMITVPLTNGTIPFKIEIKRGAAKLLLKPAPKGTGVIAGGAVRSVVEAAGINNIVSKILGSTNKASNVYATFAALKQIRQTANLKGIKLANKLNPSTAKPTKQIQQSNSNSQIKNSAKPPEKSQKNKQISAHATK